MAKKLTRAAVAAAAMAGSLISVPGAVSPRDLGDHNTPGEIYLANESRFGEQYFSEPLTTYLVGWKDPSNIEATLDFIAPPVQAPGRLFEFKQYLNAEEFLSETDDVRGIGADFKRVEYQAKDQQAKTINKGLTIRLDHDQYPDITLATQQATARLWRRLCRNELRRAVTALVTAAGSPTAKTWNTTAGLDPDQDVITARIGAADTSGISPNRLIYNEIAWNKRGLSHRAQNTAGGYASATLSIDQVAQLAGMDKGMVSKERYQVSSTTKAKILGDYVIGFYGEDGAQLEDPTNLKRFYSPVEGGGKMRVYVQVINSKFTDVTVEHYSNVISPTNLGMFILAIS